jgi:hypothetical protein
MLNGIWAFTFGQMPAVISLDYELYFICLTGIPFSIISATLLPMIKHFANNLLQNPIKINWKKFWPFRVGLDEFVLGLLTAKPNQDKLGEECSSDSFPSCL